MLVTGNDIIVRPVSFETIAKQIKSNIQRSNVFKLQINTVALTAYLVYLSATHTHNIITIT